MKTKMLCLFCLLVFPLSVSAQINIVWDIPDSLRETVFSDDFDDNRNEWPLEVDGVKLKIKKGIYEIDNTHTEGSCNMNYKGVDFSREFTIECKMRKAKGDNDSVWLGLIWGYQTDADFSNLLVGADGTYLLAVRSLNDYKKVVDWQEHSALKKKGDFNVLRVERRANSVTFLGQKLKNLDQYTYHFYLNGSLVKTINDWPAVWGDWLGFRVSEDAKIEVDYVKVTVP